MAASCSKEAQGQDKQRIKLGAKGSPGPRCLAENRDRREGLCLERSFQKLTAASRALYSSCSVSASEAVLTGRGHVSVLCMDRPGLPSLELTRTISYLL